MQEKKRMAEIQVPIRSGTKRDVLLGRQRRQNWSENGKKQPLLNLVGIQIVPRVFALCSYTNDIALADCPIAGINTHSMARPGWVVAKIRVIRFQRSSNCTKFLFHPGDFLPGLRIEKVD